MPFRADDGTPLRLTNIRGDGAPVLLVHGAGVRSAIFHRLGRALAGAGRDVWLLDWRGSIDLPARSWTLDEVALFDHPAAVRTVLAETGADRLSAVVHCQGSVTFMMALCAGLLPRVDTVVSNAVSLHPVVPAWSRVKLRAGTPVVSRLLTHLDPSWGLVPPRALTPRVLTALVRAFHHECDNLVCKLVSFTYGSGRPALWRHENLTPETHDSFIPHEFGPVPMTFFRQMAACVRAGRLVSELPGLPRDHTARGPATDARIVLLAGAHNLCFLPESQRRTFSWLERHAPGRHALHVLPDYGHLDVLLGRHADRDVFPLILDELRVRDDVRGGA
ncbi:alpha/beta fold hydrolase [Catenuloplanes atrovinosus]|uniref:Pimeloyl-ACP methyl ester carboxylesterase n=1 Tax=Catenuloplanes atrovinosus TaxID=137266 RepID=A0AAE3YNJ1_9ACTN|nr:alpha/beta fold hydrolase [Catenuloplanes atrovinosus]MDR7275777.1 pimeloyl-ACP methyl ester carboxylesterase [Catenuloplanes atrovinosus]